MYSTRADTQMVELVVALDTRSGEILCFVYTMVIKTELWTRVHSPVVRAELTADQQVPGSIPGGDIGSIFIGMFSGTIL